MPRADAAGPAGALLSRGRRGARGAVPAGFLFLFWLLLLWPPGTGWAAAPAAGDTASGPSAIAISRGRYLVEAGGCAACHTDAKDHGQPFAGGRALKTPFGTFYTPNITPDRATGIGGWSDAQFLRALKQGIAPDGSYYYPAFPYPSFTRIRAADALDIKAYLFSLPPVRHENRPHDLRFPFSLRPLLVFWRLLYFHPGDFHPDPARSAAWNRGAYLVIALGHCGECHTPRTFLGGMKPALFLAGTNKGPEGEIVPNLTPDRGTGLGDWGQDDIVTLLKTGMKPDFDNVQGAMTEVIRGGLGQLDDSDLAAIATYLHALPPIRHKVGH